MTQHGTTVFFFLPSMSKLLLYLPARGVSLQLCTFIFNGTAYPSCFYVIFAPSCFSLIVLLLHSFSPPSSPFLFSTLRLFSLASATARSSCGRAATTTSSAEGTRPSAAMTHRRSRPASAATPCKGGTLLGTFLGRGTLVRVLGGGSLVFFSLVLSFGGQQKDNEKQIEVEVLTSLRRERPRTRRVPRCVID